MSGSQENVVVVGNRFTHDDPVAIAKAEAAYQRRQQISALKKYRDDYQKAIKLIEAKLLELGEGRPRLCNREGFDIEEAFVEAFLNLRGIKQACAALNVSSHTVRRFMKEVPEFADRLENAREDITDEIEAGLAADILAGKFNPIERLAWLNANRPDRYQRGKKVTFEGEVKHSHSWEEVVQSNRRQKMAEIAAGDGDEFILDLDGPLPRLPDGLDAE